MKIKIQIDPEIADIVPGYLENRKNEIKKMLEALASSNFSKLYSMGHQIKGSGKGYGFDRLSELGAQLEESSKKKDESAINKDIAEIIEYLNSIELVP